VNTGRSGLLEPRSGERRSSGLPVSNWFLLCWPQSSKLSLSTQEASRWMRLLASLRRKQESTE
jgi:hypothetical protein